LKLLLQIFLFLLTWFNLSSTPSLSNAVLPNYAVSFAKATNQNLESEIKIGVSNFARSGISENLFSQKAVLWESSVLENRAREVNVNVVSTAGRFIANSGVELKTFLDDLVTLPAGKPYSDKIYKSVSKNAELTHNAKPDIISEYSIEEAWGRYDLQGESGMYYSKTLVGNQTEMSVYGDWNAYSTYEFNNVQINNMLDLTDPSTIEQLGSEFNKLVITTGTKSEMYEFTNVLSTWVRSKGYKGLIVPGARGTQDYINVLVFNQSDLTSALSGIIPIKLK